MKFISISILLICLLSATFSQWILIFSYDLNQNYIAKELCVNRNNPNSHCNGHCFLSKQMNNEQKSESTNSAKEKFEIQLFCNELSDKISIVFLNKNCYHLTDQKFAQQQYLQICFHPPCV